MYRGVVFQNTSAWGGGGSTVGGGFELPTLTSAVWCPGSSWAIGSAGCRAFLMLCPLQLLYKTKADWNKRADSVISGIRAFHLRLF